MKLIITLIFLFSGIAQSAEKTIIEQIYIPKLDVVFIMDDSLSMQPRQGEIDVQKLLAANSGVFINQLSKIKFLNYHIGVVSSSSASLKTCRGERNRKYVTSKPSESKTKYECLSEMMQVNLSGGNAFEDFLMTPITAIFSNKSYFYRSGAHLGIFAITNSDHSYGIGREVLDPQGAYEILLTLKKGDKNKVNYSAAISTVEEHPYSRSCEMESLLPSSHKLSETVKLSGGQLFELCDFNYGKVLFEFAQSLVESVLTVPLKSLPLSSNTIEVYFEDRSLLFGNSNDWTYLSDDYWTYNEENNSIILSRDIDESSQFLRFKIKYEPASSSL